MIPLVSHRVEFPQRIVSLVPSHTESLHDLGAAQRVVGRTRFCIAPAPWVDSIPVVGGTKDASFEKIMARKPDLVLADKDENPLALVEQLDVAGVPVLWSDIESVSDTGEWLEELGAQLGLAEAGRAARAEIDGVVESMVRTESLPVFCPIWHNPWMTFNRSAYPSAMLDAVGFRNVFAVRDGPKYFEVTARDVVDSDALHTLLPTEPFPFHRRRDVVGTQELGKAGGEGRAHVIDGEALTWFGTRTAAGLRELAAVRASLDSA